MKSLFTQICNEWRTNVWLALELLVVSVVMWYIADFLYSKLATFNEPRGFNTEHCYKINFAWLNGLSPEYVNDTTMNQTIYEVLDRFKRRPEIEAVSLSMYAHPYNGSNSSAMVQYDSLMSTGFVVKRFVTPDFLRVFRYEGVRGETSDQLAEMLTRNHVMVSDNVFNGSANPVKASELINERLVIDGDSSSTDVLAASLKIVRYSDHESALWSKTMVAPLPDEYLPYANELCVRVRENMDKDFIESIMNDSESQFRVGNFYICGVQSFDTIRDNFQRKEDRELRNYVVGMVFLLVNIFLGLLGTFWFRTQQRVSEIAVRMVSGATRADIFKRLTGEGLFLLTLVTPLALAVDINLAYMELNSFYGGEYLQWSRVLVSAGVVYVAMAAMVVSGIYFPARRAMSIEPAVALHDE